MKNRKVVFTPPVGVVPEGTKQGQRFELVTTYELEKDGKVCVKKVGDADMPGYKDDDESRGGHDYGDMAQEMIGARPEEAM